VKKLNLPNWVLAVLTLVALFRLPTLLEPFWYGDELIYLTVGNGIRQGLLLYRDIFDHKTPLLYYLAAIAGNVFWFRAILLFWMLGTVAIFYKLASSLYPKNKHVQMVAVTFFAILTTIPFIEGTIANAEIFMIGPTIAAFYILLGKRLTNTKAMFAGLLLSVTTLLKVPAAVDIGAIVFLWTVLVVRKKLVLTNFIRSSLLLFVGWGSSLLAVTIIFFGLGALQPYLESVLLINFGFYVPAFQEAAASGPSPLLIRAGLTASGLAFLFFLRNRLSKQFLFATAWLILALFAVTIPARPYPHYFIQAVPPLALVIGVLVAGKTLEQSLAIVPLLVAFLVPVHFNFWHYPTISYYQQFLSFAAGNISREEYFQRFGDATNDHYDIANFVRSTTLPEERIFVWGDAPPIYALSRRLPPSRFVATFHIIDFQSRDETLSDIVRGEPKLIILTANAPEFHELDAYLRDNYLLIKTTQSSQIWSRVGA